LTFVSNPVHHHCEQDEADMPTEAVLHALAKIIGGCPSIHALRERIRKVATSTVPVLIIGETGTGKELCAEAIFLLSDRKPYVPVNCAAIADNLIDSEFFGYRKGAFTGAVKDHVGLIGKADGGTLFLDEVTELGSAAQAKLLRALESREYRPVGSTTTLTSRFRLLAATNADVEDRVNRGLLRRDLLYRIDAVRLLIPPLRERRDDIPSIAAHLLQQIRQQHRYGPTRFSQAAVRVLIDQDWPGNVRQLRNVVEAAAAEAGPHAELIDTEHLIPSFPNATVSHPAPAESIPPLEVSLRIASARAVRDALQVSGGNRRHAARLLRISEAKLYRMLCTLIPELQGV
jgi:DNA-binding NtrC family response regulator